MTPKDILLQILDAIDFAEDKDAFIKQFMFLVYGNAINEMIHSYPKEKQKEIESRLEEIRDHPEKLSKTLKEYFSEEYINNTLQDISENLIFEYLQTISPSLSEKQRERLSALSGKLSHQQQREVESQRQGFSRLQTRKPK